MIHLSLVNGRNVLVSGSKVEAVNGLDGCEVVLAGSSTTSLDVAGVADELAAEVGGLVKVMRCWVRPNAVVELCDDNEGTLVALLSGSVHIPGISPAEVVAILEEG